jgi:NADH-ubiquinone oxidoreductase chain 4
MLTVLLLTPLLGVAGIILGCSNERQSKQVALLASLANFALSLVLWGEYDGNCGHLQFVQDWSSVTFCHCIIGLDGLSLFFVLLTTFIIPSCILGTPLGPTATGQGPRPALPTIPSSTANIPAVKSFLIALLVVETLLIALFVVLDLLLFYICFESVLIPLFLLIGIWSHSPHKVRASFMLFLYTLFGSLFMLLSFIAIYMSIGSTDYQLIATSSIQPEVQKILWLGIFLALAIKTPLVPFHSWLPYAHVSAPLAGSIILAGLILKLATYGYLRLCLGLLPEASSYFAPLVYTLCVVSICYASLSTLRQVDLKGIIAYSSIPHVAIATMGLFSNSIQGIEGAMLLSLAHGLVSPALFICVAIIYDRWHTLVLLYYRGLTLIMPLFSLLFLVFLLANMAIPLSVNFVGEFLCFLGSFQRNPLATFIASFSVVFSGAYSIWLFNRVCYGAFSRYLLPALDITRRELYLLLPFLFLVLILGIVPNLVLDSIHLSVSSLLYQNTPRKPTIFFTMLLSRLAYLM